MHAYTIRIRAAVEKNIDSFSEGFTVKDMAAKVNPLLSANGISGFDRHSAVANELKRFARLGKLKQDKGEQVHGAGRRPAVFMKA